MRWSPTIVEEFMKRAFYKLGLSIGYHPWRYIIGLLLFTALCSVGFVRFHEINVPRITYTDSKSPSHTEVQVLQDFLQQNGTMNMLEVMVESKDNGSLLRENHRQQIWDLMNEINYEITVKNSSGHQLSYDDLCEPYCKNNDAFVALLNLHDQNFSRIDITYPTMDILGQQVFIASNIYGVSLVNGTNNIESFTTVILRYYTVYPELKPQLDWEAKVVSLLYDSGKYNLLRCSAGSDSLVAKKVKEMGSKTAPLITIALGELMIFIVLCSFRSKRRESKPIEACLGGLTPVLAGITTIGLVSATGLAFQSIVVSTLFLVLAIGIDDVFIMMASWHRTEKGMHIPKRTAEMLRISGCSMAITSLTNVISFGNGVLSSTSALQTFAIYSVAASVICYFYQLILFPAILTVTAHKEYKSIDDVPKSCLPEELTLIKNVSKFHDRAWKCLARLVGKPWMQILTIMVLIIYWTITYYGVSLVKADLDVQKIFPPDARIVQFKVRYDEVIKDMQTVAIVVTKPGDLRDPKEFAEVNSMIREYETATYSYGPQSTFCFIEPYMEFLMFHEYEEEGQEVAFNYTHIPNFIKSKPHWKGTMRINETACASNEPSCLTSFLFTTGFTTVSSFRELFPLLQEWRAVSRKHPALGIYPYTERSIFADQTNALVKVIWQTLFSEVICMGIAFALFIPDVISIIAGMFALLSVNLGVLGFLTLWGISINPISMAALLMSIGFSVDISAHISYHYHQVKGSTPHEKLEDAFLNIGWPAMQGGLITFVALLPVVLTPSYLLLVFLKTIALVSIFGIIHGLVVLPVLLSMLTSLRQILYGRLGKVRSYDFTGSSRTFETQDSKSSYRTIIKF